jgi:hypothetical protein
MTLPLSLCGLLFTCHAALPVWVPAATPVPHAPLEGRYEVTTTSGTPPIAGATVEVTVVRVPFFPLFAGSVTVDHHDGEGPQPLEGELMIITPDGAGGGTWVNARETQGKLTPTNGDDLESEVLTGANTGTKRRWNRQ